jgi:DNA-binding LytR/AlgR family response regulator
MIKTLIIEDEAPAALRLEKMLRDIDPSIRILDRLDSVESAVGWFRSHEQPDLLMLDIQLADGVSFDIFRKVRVESFVIFTTAYDEYAIKAFELNSIDYLLKPISKTRLEAAVVKFRRLQESKPSINMEELILAMEGKKATYKKRFAISIGPRIKSVETDQIAYFSSLEKNTFLGTYEGKEYPVEFSLDRLESMLDPAIFFRISRQYMVNYKAIGKIAVLSKSRLEIEVRGAPEPLLVSTARTHEFREWIDK